jgi:hypothetical protein
MLGIKTAAHRRYVWRIAIAMAGYVATLFLAEFLIDKLGVGGLLAWVLALLPGLCVASVFWALGRLLVEERDEYLRMVLARQLLTASGLTMVGVSIYGFLDLYHLVPVVPLYWLTFLFFIGLGFASLINKLLFGDPVRC